MANETDNPIELGDVTIFRPKWWAKHPATMDEAMAVASYEQRQSAGRTHEASENEPPVQRLTYSVEEAAELLGLSRSFAYDAIRKGDIPHIKIGKRILIPKVALDELLNLTKTVEPEDN